MATAGSSPASSPTASGWCSWARPAATGGCGSRTSPAANPGPLTPKEWHINRGANVSPDGKQLVVLAPDRKRLLRDLATGEDREIPGLAPGMIPSRFTPDGDALLVWWRDGQTLTVGDRMAEAHAMLTCRAGVGRAG